MQTQNFLKYISEITGLEEKNSELILSFFETLHFTNARHIKKVMRKYYFMKEYLKDKEIDIGDNRNVLLIIYIIILNIYYSDEYKYIIRSDKEKIYENIIFYFYDKNGFKKQGRYTNYKKYCNIKYNNDEQYDIHKLLVRFSSGKIKNNEMKSLFYTNGEAYSNYEDWLSIFDDNNICSEFIKFIISNNYNFKNLIKDNEFDDEKVVNILNIINDII